MKNEPLISVLLPLYNEPENLARQAIDSILAQTYKKLEIILLLDNPENDVLRTLLAEYAQKDKRIVVAINEQNRGLPDTLNRGIELATGDFIARMDGDDISTAERMEKQLTYMLTHPKTDLVGCDAYAINEEGNLIGEYHKLATDFSQKMMLRHISINLIHPTWFGKSMLFKQCRYRNFTHCEDYDFMIRAYALGYHFQNLKENLFFVRIQQTSLRSVSRKYAYEQYINTLRVKSQFKEFKKKHLKSYPDLPELSYDMKDKEKYQSTISLLNELREAFFQKQFTRFINLFIKIARKDFRPLAFRIKVFTLSKVLVLAEKIKLAELLSK